jgi:hypothetical protein
MNQNEKDPQKALLTYLLASENKVKMSLKEVLITLKAKAIEN